MGEMSIGAMVQRGGISTLKGSYSTSRAYTEKAYTSLYTPLSTLDNITC